jgi:nitrile hydratase accessory protein
VDHYDRLFGNAGYIARRIASDVSGPTAIPRRNGEPVFNDPWESRVFGAAVALCERGLFEWDEFRDRLIAEIASPDTRRSASVQLPSYYECFLSALERLLIDKGICAKEEIERLANAELPDEHDHHGKPA